MLMSNVLLAVSEAAKEAASTSVAIKGQSNLFIMPELTSSDGKRVMEFLGRSNELSKIFSSAGTKASILIGSEINNPALSNLSVVVSRYTASEECSGALALIGPVRMDYSRITSTLEYTASVVGELLGEIISG